MANNSTNPVMQLNDADAGHYRKIEGYASKVDKLYRKAIKDISALASKVGAIPQTDQFSFGHNPGIEQEVDAVISKLAGNISAVIEQGDREQWLAACTKGDAFIDAIMRTSALPKPLVSTYKARNLESLAAFQERKINGLNLSERVWQHVSVLKKEVESVVDTSAGYAMNGIDAPENLRKIEAAIGSGLSADALSREVRQCLQEPDRLFRRIRDKYGRLHMSKNAELYHPGQGVYRSSYKNAMRMTRTEINMAYRQSDYLRWQQLDFVVGIRISLSGNHTCLGADGRPHPFTDICDILAGDYPKDFKYTGWHPQCRCKAVPILKPYDEWNEDRKYLNKSAYRQLPASNSVGSLPPAYMNYIKANAKRIARWKSQPYYIKDNMHYFWHSLSPQKYPLARLSLDADTMSRLADYRMYAYTHQGSAKFGTALDAALKAQMSGDRKAFDEAMALMEFTKKTNERVQEYARQKKDLNAVASIQEGTMTFNKDLKQQRTDIKAFMEEKFGPSPRKIHLNDFGMDVEIPNNKVKEWLNQPHQDIGLKNEALRYIDKVLNLSTYMGALEDKRNASVTAHLFETRINQKKSWIIVRQQPNGSLVLHSITDSDKMLGLLKNKSQNLIAPPGTAIQITHQNLTYVSGTKVGEKSDLYKALQKELAKEREKRVKMASMNAKLKNPAELRHKYDAQIDALRTNAAKYKLDMTRIDEAYTSLDMAKIEAAIREQQAILDARVARMEKIYAAAEKRHAAEEASLGGLTRREKAEKILEERRARFEAISKKSTSLMAEAGEYTMDIDLARLKDLQARKQYNQMGRENSVIEAAISEIKAADISMAGLIPDVATLHKQFSLDELKQAYNEMDFAIKSSSSLDLRSQESYLKGVLINTGNPIVKRGLTARLAQVRTDIRIAELTPDVTDIVNASQKSSVNAFHEITARAEAALRSRDVAQAEALLDMAREMQPVADMYDKLLATGYKTSPKFNKAMADCLDALDNGDLPGALAYVQEAARIKAQNDANVARRKAREARQAAARQNAESAAKPKKKRISEAESYDDLKEILGEDMPPMLANYEKSVARKGYTKKEYLDDAEAFRDKMKAMFDDSNFSHCTKYNTLEGYLDKGILNQHQTRAMGIYDKGKGYDESRYSYEHFAFGFQNDQGTVPKKDRMRYGDYYRCGVPVSKDKTKAYKQLSGYGGAQIVLKKDNVVTTFTFDNSLGQETIPSLTCDPKVCSLDSKNMRRFKDIQYDVKTVADGSWNDYIEIQYLPKKKTEFITVDDFESITLGSHPEGVFINEHGKKATRGFWEKWAEKGCSIYYYDAKSDSVILYMEGRAAIPAKYNETAAQRKARLAKMQARAKARHEERDKNLRKQGLTAEAQIDRLIKQRAEETARYMSESQAILADINSLVNADFGIDKFKRLEELVKAGNARGAKTEMTRISEELQRQKKELEKLKDLIPDYDRWHKDFTIQELKDAHDAIRKQIDWMENRYPKRDDPNEVIGKWGRIAKYVENPDSGVRSVTWQIARDAYIRKQDELIYQYRRDSIDENLSRIKAFKTKDKEFAEIRKELQIQSSAGRWGKVEELIESAKKMMIELTPSPVSDRLLKLGECAQVLFKSEDFDNARKDAAKWFRAKKETSVQINKAFKEADAYMSQYAEEMWKNLTKEEKMVLWLYSDGSQYINQEILGTYCLRMKSWIDHSLRNGLADANVLTSIIEKAPALRDDIWMQTGKSVDAFRSMFGTSLSPGMNLNGLVGKEGTNELFMSCHAARNGAFTKNANTGMSNDVVMTIYMPKGTKGVYMEPFASWGDSKRGEEGFKWDGKRRKEAPSDQVEFLLQRGARFRITKAKYENGKWFIDVDLIEQKAAGMLNTTIPDIDYRPIRFKKPTS